MTKPTNPAVSSPTLLLTQSMITIDPASTSAARPRFTTRTRTIFTMDHPQSPTDGSPEQGRLIPSPAVLAPVRRPPYTLGPF